MGSYGVPSRTRRPPIAPGDRAGRASTRSAGRGAAATFGPWPRPLRALAVDAGSGLEELADDIEARNAVGFRVEVGNDSMPEHRGGDRLRVLDARGRAPVERRERFH